MASNLPGLGSSDLVPLVNRELDYVKAGLTSDEYFVLTRIDGRTTLRQLLLISGFPEGQAVTILRHLRQVGAIYFRGEDPSHGPPAAAFTASANAPAVPARPEGSEAHGAAVDGDPGAALPDEAVVPPAEVVIDESRLAEEVELTLEQKRLILTKHGSIAGSTHFSMLEVPRDVDKRVLRRAYQRLSKDFHPDRFFGRRLGSYEALLAEIFEVLSEANRVLSDDDRRSEYVTALADTRSGSTPPLGSPVPGSAGGPRVAPSEKGERLRAAAIYEDACHHEVLGEVARALGEFAAAIAIDPQPKFLRRAAEASLRAQELRDAEEYAKKAAELDPQNAAVHRVMGKIYRAQGRLPEARRALDQASRLDPGNSHIAAEVAELRLLPESGT